MKKSVCQEKLDIKLIEEIENSSPIYSMVPECVMKSPELAKHLSAFRTFTILNSYAGNTGVCWTSNKTIQEKYPDQTEKVVRDNLRILIKLGFVFRALDRKSRKGTRRFLVFVGNWQNYFEKCKKIGNLKEAGGVQSFFEKVPFETCFESIQKIFSTDRQRAVDHQPVKVCSREQKKQNIKETTKKRQNFSLNQTQNQAAAASFQNLSFDQKLFKNLGSEGTKRALAFWNSFDEMKQKRTRNPIALLTSAIKGNWDKEAIQSPSQPKVVGLRTASEMNREFALIVSDLVKPNQGLSTHMAKDYFEIYNGPWNKVFHFGEPNTLFKTEVTRRLKKMGIKIPQNSQN